MSEWWTYSLHDFLLFSPRTYYRQIELYNAQIWPGQVLAWLANGVIALLAMCASRSRREVGHRDVAGEDRIGVCHRTSGNTFRTEWGILAVLAAAWACSAWGWLGQRYTTINWTATYMAALFGVEAAMLLVAAARSFVRMRSEDRAIVRAWSLPPVAGEGLGTRAAIGGSTANGRERHRSLRSVRIGFVLLIVSLAYPAMAILAGRPPTTAEVFAAMPDPTVIATLGCVVLVSVRTRWLILFIPLVWCAVGGLTLWAMQSPDALLLPIAGVGAIVAASGKCRTRGRWAG